MEAVAAFALAGNILQFLQSAGKFTSLVWNIHHYQADALQDLSILRTIAEDLQHLMPQMQIPSSQRESLSVGHPQTVKLAEQCSKILRELLQSLDSIQGSSGNSRQRHAQKSKINAFVTACKTVWNKDKITKLEETMQNIRQQLVANLLITIR